MIFKNTTGILSSFSVHELMIRIGMFVFITLSICLMTPGTVFAKSGIVFLDASRSIAEFRETFRIIMRQIGSSARRSGNYQLHFCPIGDAAQGETKACISSNLQDRELRSALERKFTYKDQFTRIIKSLRAPADHMLQGASTVMIVTDMAPDHKRSGGQWAFSGSDMDDLKETGEKLDQLLSSARKEKMLIVLLDWNKKPAEFLSAREKENPAATFAEIRRKLKRRLGANRYKRPGVEHNSNIYQKAAAAVVYGLRKKHKEKLMVMTMNRGSRGDRNDTTLRMAACSVFKDFLNRAAWCQTGSTGPEMSDRPERRKFVVQVDLERFANESALKEEFKRVLARDVVGRGCSSTKKIQLRFAKYNPNRVERDQAASQADFIFPLCQMRTGGQQGGCEHPDNPLVSIERIGWQGFRRSSNGTVRSIRPLRGIAGGLTPPQARTALVREIRILLERSIQSSYPAQQVYRTIRLSQKSPACGANETSCQAREGHSVIAKYSCGEGGETETFETRISDVEGIVTIRIPKLAKNVKIYHKYPTSRGFEKYDTKGLIRELDSGFARSRQDVSITIPDELFVGRKPKVIWPAGREAYPYTKTGKLSIRLKTRTAATYLQTMPPIEIRGETGDDIYQLPGIYEIRLDVNDPRLQSAVLFGELWKESEQSRIFASGAWETPDGQAVVAQIDDMEIRVREDPFVYKPENSSRFRYQTGKNPNYLKSPQAVWRTLREFIGRDGRLTVPGKESLQSSRNFLWAFLSVVAANFDNVSLHPDTSPAEEKEQIRKLAAAIFTELFGSGGNNEEIQRMVEPALSRIGLIDMNEQPMPEAQLLLKILLLNIHQRNLCSSGISLERTYDERTTRVYNEWLIQSSIEDRNLAGEGGVARYPRTHSGGRLSQTPFTEKLRNKCRLNASRGG